MSPEVFFWMELEGYGKVLSRPGLDLVDREIAIVACLMIEHRPAQLHSHLRGALNVGAPDRLVLDVVSDLRPFSPQGYPNACEILQRLGVS
jgi:alkylhydroperoxidase/carboxymuconolactone decarboxylase family protein YurZ